jgi:transcriptional regulator with XRE-family HTH domain
VRLGKAIKIALIKQERTQNWLAKELGVSRPYLSAICGDHKNVSIKKAEFIAGKLGMKLSELVALAEES